eukprot:502735-Hanusia_phi.AAC.1
MEFYVLVSSGNLPYPHFHLSHSRDLSRESSRAFEAEGGRCLDPHQQTLRLQTAELEGPNLPDALTLTGIQVSALLKGEEGTCLSIEVRRPSIRPKAHESAEEDEGVIVIDELVRRSERQGARGFFDNLIDQLIVKLRERPSKKLWKR